MERFFDLFFSSLALILLSPLFFLTALILRFSGEGEIFFLQERVGKHGKVFKLIKFATMLKDSPNMGTGTVTVRGDPRVLPIGKFLRRTKVNELPQLLNIFVGDMSIVGPRPLTSQTFGCYPAETQKIIEEVRPGLSGIGSIIFRGEEEIMHGASASLKYYSDVIAPYKGSLEEWFVRKKSLYIYFLAIFITVWVVLSPNTRVAWKVFSDLPHPPLELEKALYHSD